jgi:LAO/AO transport system kinase
MAGFGRGSKINSIESSGMNQLSNAQIAELTEQFAQGDRRALARILSMVQNDSATMAQFAPPTSLVNSSGQPPLVVGITGGGGVGKSTLIGALVGLLRNNGLRVAVLANDPQSPLTGGSLLGDRIRIKHEPNDEGVFIRSTSTRGAAGGVAETTAEVCRWLAAFGFDVILVETVGVGQDQAAVRSAVDRLLLVVTPGGGDEVQWEKAGLIEVADVIAVNKSDLPGADRVAADLVRVLSLSHATANIPVVQVSAASGTGVDQLWSAISNRKLT